jgi:hypothetical protein
MTAQPDAVTLNGDTEVEVVAGDPDPGDPLTYSWSADEGTFGNPSARTTRWTAPDSAGTFTLTVLVKDKADSTEGSIDVLAGNVSLTVESDPPDAFITRDGRPTQFRTPHTFDPLAPGFHQVRIFNPDFAYATDTDVTDLAHGESDTMRFATDPSRSDVLDLGRDDFLEIGGIGFLETGTGFVYSARTVGGTGLFTSALSPASGTPSGIKLLTGVRIEEPISVSADGNHVFFVNEGESLMVADIVDVGGNGIVDSVGAVRFLRHDTYGPAISTSEDLAFTLSRSEEPATLKILWDAFQDSVLADQAGLATTNNGRLPAWEPGQSSLVYEGDGIVFTTFVSEEILFPPDTLAAGGFNTAPAWGPWGSPHLTYLHGPDAMGLNEIRLAAPGNSNHITVHSSLIDPRFMAWSPVQQALVVTHNPGKGQVLLIFNLPLP